MKKRCILIIFAVFLAITGIGCGETGSDDSDGSTPTCVLTVTPCSGAVTSSPQGINCGSGSGEDSCTKSFDCGTEVTLTATPATGYYFLGWSGDCSVTGAEPGACADTGTIMDTCTVTMTTDKTCSGTFLAQ